MDTKRRKALVSSDCNGMAGTRAGRALAAGSGHLGAPYTRLHWIPSTEHKAHYRTLGRQPEKRAWAPSSIPSPERVGVVGPTRATALRKPPPGRDGFGSDPVATTAISASARRQSPTTARGRGLRKAPRGGRLREVAPLGGVVVKLTQAVLVARQRRLSIARHRPLWITLSSGPARCRFSGGCTPDRSKLFGSHGQRPWVYNVLKPKGSSA
jgi:hypothetical protein